MNFSNSTRRHFSVFFKTKNGDRCFGMMIKSLRNKTRWLNNSLPITNLFKKNGGFLDFEGYMAPSGSDCHFAPQQTDPSYKGPNLHVLHDMM